LDVTRPRNSTQFPSFEFLEINIKSGSKTVHVFVVYQPGRSNENGITHGMLMNDFSSLLDYAVIKDGH
jgi:hypothetical protein